MGKKRYHKRSKILITLKQKKRRISSKIRKGRLERTTQKNRKNPSLKNVQRILKSYGRIGQKNKRKK